MRGRLRKSSESNRGFYMLRENISDILKSPGEQKTIPINDYLSNHEGIDLTSPVIGVATLTNTGTLLLVQGKVSAEVKLTCSRCLDEMSCPLEAELAEEFEIKTDGGPEGAKVIESEYEEDLGSILSETEINLEELIRQSLLVAIPLQPLCREDCKGLCPNCGKNLNEGPCDCAKDDTESPFAALKDLLNEDTNE